VPLLAVCDGRGPELRAVLEAGALASSSGGTHRRGLQPAALEGGLVGASLMAEQKSISDLRLEGAPETGPGKALVENCWRTRQGQHGTFKMRFDREDGKKHGTLAVRDVEGFEDGRLAVWAHVFTCCVRTTTDGPS
jgi:hypothetical protein